MPTALSNLIRLRKGVSYKGEFLDKPGPRLLGLGTLLPGGGLKLEEARSYSGPVREEQRIRPGELLVSLTDITQDGRVLGTPALLPPRVRGEFAVTHHVARVQVTSPKDLDTRFLYYLFQSPEFKDFVRGVATGTTVRSVSIADVLSFKAPLPPLPTQRDIASFLGSIDDKIELNRQVNQSLELLMRALFDSWFVDFDPVRAKAESRWKRGESCPGMPTDTWDLWPTEFADSEIGDIPKGWRVGALSEIAKVTMGQSPPGDTYNEMGRGLPFFQGVRDFGSRFPTRRVYCTAPARFADQGDILLSVRAPIGRVNVATEHCAIGRGLCSIKPLNDSLSFVYYLLRAQTEAWVALEANGTVFGAAAKADINDLPVIMPTDELVRAFNRVVAPLDARYASSHKENEDLVRIRDTLLPKLLSGETIVRKGG